MQVTHSVFSDKEVRVTAGYYEWQHLQLFLTINEPHPDPKFCGKNLYHSLFHSSLDWTSVRTVRNELTRLAVPVPEKFLTDLALEYIDAKRSLIYRMIPDDDGEQLNECYCSDISNDQESATRRLNTLDTDDDADLPF